MAIKVVEHDFDGAREAGIYIVEFGDVKRDDFALNWSPTAGDEERLYRLPLNPASETVYRIVPPVGGLNA